jgi:NADH:ubiquinone oxidoreductase subunit C
MENDLIIEKLKEKYGDNIKEVIVKSYKRIIITIDPGSLLDISAYLFKDVGYRFVIASALHTNKGFEIHYHFSYDSTGLLLNLHVILSADKPEIESLSNMFNASNWIEREMHELFGINFLNHPNLEKLISEGNWAEGVYPYRKDFKKALETKE